jgi:O-antigen ligase
LLFLGLTGMAWANVSWGERFGGADSFGKLAAIPLLFAQFRRSDRASWLLAGYLGSCTVLLAFFWVTAIRDMIVYSGADRSALPIRSAATEMSEFVVCGVASLFVAIDELRAKRRLSAAGTFALGAVFISIVVYVVARSTRWFVLPLGTALPMAALLLLLVFRQLSAKAMSTALAAGAISCAFAYLILAPIHNGFSVAELLGPSRPVYWSKSLHFIAEAPIIGHGTGSIGSLFAQSAKNQTGTMAEIATNPFQETLSIGIQLGIVGVVVIWTMWISHLRLFRGQSFADWIGLIIVIYAITGSLFDSEIFDSHRGWLYVFGVGVAGGAVLRKRNLASTSEASVFDRLQDAAPRS